MEDIQKIYSELKPNYERLSVNIKDALHQFVKDEEIPIFEIEKRVKTLDSFKEKITRKEHASPFEDIEDICGVRVICYYQEDLEKLKRIIHNEFNVISEIDKKKELSESQFGYSSHHYIVKLKKGWLDAPNYRGLDDLKVEIQVRTMLMHTWAAISHKLSYKKSEDIPWEFKRKLNRLSALIELADEQFDQIKNIKIEYKNNISFSENGSSSSIELNTDSLMALMEHYFNDRAYKEEDIPSLLDELRDYSITLNDLEKRIKLCLPFLPDMEREEMPDRELPSWHFSGVIRTVLDLTSDEYFNDRSEGLPEEMLYMREKYKAFINSK